MSLRNRARRLQHKTGATYQQALTRLRTLGAEPAELARRNRWPLARCDLFLVDRALDDEWRAVAARSRTVAEAPCVCCGATFFSGDAERRGRVDACPACRAAARPMPPGHAPHDARSDAPRGRIEVLELEPSTRVDLLRDLCADLLLSANARAVLLVDAHGRQLAHAGPMASADVLLARSLTWGTRRSLAELLGEPRVLELDGPAGRSLYLEPVGKRALLMVLFGAATSLGLVRLRARAAAEILERLLARVDAPWGGPPGSSGAAGGSPAQAALEVAAVRRRHRS